MNTEFANRRLTPLRIEPATVHHLDVVRAAYSDARATQRAQGASLWPVFSDESIVAQIASGQLFGVMAADALVGVFTVAYEDAAIWGQRERGAHVYLHRIARVSSYAGRGLMDAVLEWARDHCRALGREGIRMDTWATNERLIALYVRYGFRVLERRRIGNDPRLPPHYHGNEFALLELLV
jgi:ribosomal protein S18 acetylase RimI-like enzyme